MIIVCCFLIVLIGVISYVHYLERRRLVDLIVSKDTKDFFMLQQKKTKKELEAVGLNDYEEAMIEQNRMTEEDNYVNS